MFRIMIPARMKSKSVVLDCFERKGEFLICFGSHDGIFKLSPQDTELIAKVRAARDSRQEIAFTYDRELRILTIES